MGREFNTAFFDTTTLENNPAFFASERLRKNWRCHQLFAGIAGKYGRIRVQDTGNSKMYDNRAGKSEQHCRGLRP